AASIDFFPEMTNKATPNVTECKPYFEILAKSKEGKALDLTMLYLFLPFLFFTFSLSACCSIIGISASTILSKCFSASSASSSLQCLKLGKVLSHSIVPGCGFFFATRVQSRTPEE
ncbi:MAG: hypothetical protein O9262_00175, partial [Cyclobacteriaceae bacterium]|nr:hypothetical protein [Cyclobacteriaceae bacterium]